MLNHITAWQEAGATIEYRAVASFQIVAVQNVGWKTLNEPISVDLYAPIAKIGTQEVPLKGITLEACIKWAHDHRRGEAKIGTCQNRTAICVILDGSPEWYAIDPESVKLTTPWE